MSVLRILIADDHEVARKGIRALLENHVGWEVCGEARDGREAVESAAKSEARCAPARHRNAELERAGCGATDSGIGA